MKNINDNLKPMLAYEGPGSPMNNGSKLCVYMIEDNGTEDGGAILSYLPSSITDEQIKAVCAAMGWRLTQLEREEN